MMAGPRTTTASARVLVVEDDRSLCSVLASHLGARGHEVRTAASAEDASELLGSGYRPSIVVLDLNLPGDTGWALLRSGPLADADAPPVVVVTATHVSPSRLREFAVAGYLPKPFALETLVSTIERLLAPEEPEQTP
jgi:DNA-binding response OmpR family regulator